MTFGKKMKSALLILMSTACACASRAEVVPAKKLLGDARVAIIEKATRCRAELISSKPAGMKGDFQSYKIESKSAPRELSPEALRTLRDALLKDWDDNGLRSGCMPIPGVRYIFNFQSESVSLIVCYRCKAVIVEEGGKAVAGRPGDDIAEPLRKVAASFLTADQIKSLP